MTEKNIKEMIDDWRDDLEDGLNEKQKQAVRIAFTKIDRLQTSITNLKYMVALLIALSVMSLLS